MQIHRLRRHLPEKTRKIEDLLASPANLLSSILIGNTVVNVAATNLGCILAEQFFPKCGAWIAIPSISLLLIFLGDFVPKRFAVRHPEALAVSYLKPLKTLIWPAPRYTCCSAG